jgi:hypothetical protein
MGRARKQIQPAEILQTQDWLKKKMADNWVYDNDYADGEHPAHDNLAGMKAEFEQARQDGRLRMLLTVRRSGETQEAFEQRKQEDQQRSADNAAWLTNFCERWLLSRDWDQLKSALRQHRKRQASSADATKRIEVSAEVADMLRLLTAMHDDCDTQSDVLERYLREPYEALEPLYKKQQAKAQDDLVNALPLLDAAALIYVHASEYKRLFGQPLTIDASIPLEQSIDKHLKRGENLESLRKLMMKFEKAPNKWRGLAKRRWPELKEGNL